MRCDHRRLPSIVLGEILSYKHYFPIIVELKRAISRSLTLHGVLDPNKPNATRRLLDVFTEAQEQIELSAYHADGEDVELIAYRPSRRYRPMVQNQEEFRASELHWMSDKAIMNQFNEHSSDDSSDPEDPPNPDEWSAQWDSIAPEANFAEYKGELKKMSYLADWSAPVLLGTPAAEKM